MTIVEDAVKSVSPEEEALENADYHRHHAVSKSHLDQVARSPLHYWARYVDPNRVEPEPTPAMTIGTALHSHVLELDTWDQRYVVMPEGIDRRTKAGKAEWEAFSVASSGRSERRVLRPVATSATYA